MKKSVEHISILSKKTENLKTSDGKNIEIWELNLPKDSSLFDAWAKHFREHYCLDSEIDILRTGYNITRKEYLEKYVFPDKTTFPGPQTRAGDFCEILICDLIEYLMHFWVPRYRYDLKDSKNFSTRGSDVIGFKIDKVNPRNSHLIVVEVKGKLSPKPHDTDNKLQEAIDHSDKDDFRLGISLNAVKKRLLKEGKPGYTEISYFQDRIKNYYTKTFGAAVVLTNENVIENVITETTTQNHKNKDNLILLLIKGKDLMFMVHSLYERAANEA